MFPSCTADPFLDEFDFVVGDAAFVAIGIGGGLGFPGWHEAFGRYFGDGCALFGNVFVGEKRKRRGLAGTMAGRAVVIDDGGDVFVESDRGALAYR